MKTFKVISMLLILSLAVLTSVSQARSQKYMAKQISLKIDGNLGEWNGANIIKFDQLKDVGANIPDPKDFSGTGMIGWNPTDPNRIYFAADITDDINQDIHPAGDLWWEDDSLEIMFDFDNNAILVQWTIDANGKEISAAATVDNLKWIVVKKANGYIYEGAIDPSKDNPALPGVGKNFKAEVGKIIGLAFHFNECENGTREHQIGWTPGGAWDANAYGDLIFDAAKAPVDIYGKLVTTWANLKR